MWTSPSGKKYVGINGKGGFDKYGNYHVKKTAYNFIWKKLSDYKNLKVVSDGVAQIS